MHVTIKFQILVHLKNVNKIPKLGGKMAKKQKPKSIMAVEARASSFSSKPNFSCSALLLASFCSTGFRWGTDQVHKQNHNGDHRQERPIFCQQLLQVVRFGIFKREMKRYRVLECRHKACLYRNMTQVAGVFPP